MNLPSLLPYIIRYSIRTAFLQKPAEHIRLLLRCAKSVISSPVE